VFNPFDVPPLRHTYDFLRRASLSGADQVLTYSQYLARRAHTFGASTDDISVIPFGTNPDVFYPEEVPDLRDTFEAEEHPIILSAGRLVRKKGFDTAIRALDHITDTLPDVRLLIAGDGPERPKLERLIQDLGLTDHVQFLGNVPHSHLRKYYNLADAFLMAGHEEPDDIEGFGLVYIEANACGTPTIGARVGGVPDAVRHGETGLLVPPQDPSATADALIRLLTNPDLAERLGRKGRQRVLDEANWDHVADRIYTLLSREAA
jgi:phosphatidylinositol alpha-1,6-mannosyltransferase